MAGLSRKKIDTVVAELHTARTTSTPTCLVLGAGASRESGIPLWEDLASHILTELGVEDWPNADTSAVVRLETYLDELPTNRDLVLKLVDRSLEQVHPSRGYRYLASLIQQGFYQTVVTTNWDWLLEDSLFRVMRADQILILTRDSTPDDVIAEQIAAAGRRVVVLKLHGDPKSTLRMQLHATGVLPIALLEALSPRLAKIQLVGSSASDGDLVQLLGHRKGRSASDVLVVSPDPANLEEPLSLIATGVAGGRQRLSALRYRTRQRGLVEEPQDDKQINVGEFDHFFCQLTLGIERRSLKGQQAKLQAIEHALLQKEERGLSYINYSQITRMAKVFLGQITRFGTPDIVFFVNDPAAPGGMELKKRIESDLIDQGIAVGVLEIQGENNRSFRRQFRGPEGAPSLTTGVGDPAPDARLIHILDSIAFSGNTLRIARDKVREWYPSAEVRLGALVVSQLLVENESGLPEAERYYFETITDRFEIFFPWGVTQATADFDRRFPGLEGERLVHIARRPWGAIEILADEEVCSVRLLTIESHRRLSFQRHLCRDELFVALDDNIGLDVCAADLQPDADSFHPSVKSMVLEKGDYILIPRGIWHRTKASMDRVRLLELGFGVYDQQYDIERLFDDFERTQADGTV